jgi:hypothetical protein
MFVNGMFVNGMSDTRGIAECANNECANKRFGFWFELEASSQELKIKWPN